MLPGRNLEALQSIGLKGVNRGGKTNRRGGRGRMGEGENAQEHEDTKRREHREASRSGGMIGRRTGERGGGGGERVRKSENEYGVNEGVIHGAPAARFPVRGRKVLISRNYVRPAPAASTNFQFLRLLVSSSNSSSTYSILPAPSPSDL